MKKMKKSLYLMLIIVVSITYIMSCGERSKPESHDHELQVSELEPQDHDHEHELGGEEHEQEEAEELYQNHDHAYDNEQGEPSKEIIFDPEVIAEVGIKIVPVSKQDIKETKTYPGTVVPRPDGETLVGSLVGGRVVEIPVGLGDTVSKESPLCRIESPEVGEAQSAYIIAVAENQFAQKELIRYRKLRAENIDSEKRLLEIEAQAQSARAELNAAELVLHSIGFSESEIESLILNHSTSLMLTLRSPIAGTVVNRAIRLGQRVEPEDDLFHIVDLSRLWVKMPLYEKDTVHIRFNQFVDIIPQSLPDKVFQGRVVRIGKEVNNETRTVDCFIEIANMEEILIPNLFVTCRVQIEALANQVLIVPEESIVIDEHGDRSVYIEHEPHHFVLREVELGRTSDGCIEVLDGLAEGERVVFKGAFFITSEIAKGSFGHGHEH